jgi:stalled ribosome rescue protein Dom34
MTKESEGLELLEMALKNRTEVIEISSHHHGGEMLIGLGGVAVVLRYKLT